MALVRISADENGMSNDAKGYLTPDPPDPPDVICIKVFIPKHDLYIAAFWGAYQFFTNWNAWARDPLKKGKEAARVWTRAFEMARAHWLIFQGDCGDMINNLRPKPLNPCVLQALNDDGEWVDIFDASCCGGSSGGCGDQLRLNGGTIERYDTGSGTWVPAGPDTPPVTVPVAPPPYPPSGDGACLAATNFGALIEDRKNKLAEAVGTLTTFGDAFLTGYDVIISLTGMGFVLAVIADIFSLIYSALNDDYADVAAYDITEMAVCLAVPHYQNDGSMAQNHVDLMLLETQVLIDSFDPNSPEATAWRYVYSWIKAAGPAGMQTAANFMGITEGDCDSCPWSETLDFRGNPQGFTVGDFNPDPAFYNSGYLTAGGWEMQLKDHVGGPVPELDIMRLTSGTTLVRVVVEYTSVHGDEPNEGGRRIVAQGVEIESDWGSGDAIAEFEFDPPIGVSQWHLQAEGRSSGNPLPTAKCTIHKVTYTGTGSNPFRPPLPPVSP